MNFSSFRAHCRLCHTVVRNVYLRLCRKLIGVRGHSDIAMSRLFTNKNNSDDPIMYRVTTSIFNLPMRHVRARRTDTINYTVITFVSRNICNDCRSTVRRVMRGGSMFVPGRRGRQACVGVCNGTCSRLTSELGPVRGCLRRFRAKKR